MNAKEMARGLSLIGQTFSGKNKSIEEVFIRGKNIDLPAGIELYVQIKTPIVVYGVRTGNDYAAPAAPVPTVESTPAPAQTPAPPTYNEQENFDDSEPAPKSNVTTAPPAEAEPLPAEEKNLDGYDGEIIEIVDEN